MLARASELMNRCVRPPPPEVVAATRRDPTADDLRVALGRSASGDLWAKMWPPEERSVLAWLLLPGRWRKPFSSLVASSCGAKSVPKVRAGANENIM